MSPHTCAMIAASAYAYISGQKVAGMHDHASGRDLQIAAESRGTQLQGYDGDRGVKFGGAIPELYDAGDKAYVSMEISGDKARGHDRKSGTSYSALVSNGRAQVYDYAKDTWFTFDVQVA
jgi:hypothetical protein